MDSAAGTVLSSAGTMSRPTIAEQPLENLRPQHIYDAIILREIDPQNEIAVMENNFEFVTDAKHHQVQQADYEIEVIRKGDHGWFLSRKDYLQPDRSAASSRADV